ncbi:Ribosomal RNA large subunit methyltransferase K/L [Frankliniella fusca]|uniref:Ribosomal RNA large subunit methyltransferase K/L n=1 Tax=Frankliniella fusca TaxID=407009 RepID=A0AAE1HZT7_9NEOP|nr:Ribosomal RNA large subunit methyltransferase K/L [Frankliniella fusca]
MCSSRRERSAWRAVSVLMRASASLSHVATLSERSSSSLHCATPFSSNARTEARHALSPARSRATSSRSEQSSVTASAVSTARSCSRLCTSSAWRRSQSASPVVSSSSDVSFTSRKFQQNMRIKIFRWKLTCRSPASLRHVLSLSRTRGVSPVRSSHLMTASRTRDTLSPTLFISARTAASCFSREEAAESSCSAMPRTCANCSRSSRTSASRRASRWRVVSASDSVPESVRPPLVSLSHCSSSLLASSICRQMTSWASSMWMRRAAESCASCQPMRAWLKASSTSSLLHPKSKNAAQICSTTRNRREDALHSGRVGLVLGHELPALLVQPLAVRLRRLVLLVQPQDGGRGRIQARAAVRGHLRLLHGLLSGQQLRRQRLLPLLERTCASASVVSACQLSSSTHRSSTTRLPWRPSSISWYLADSALYASSRLCASSGELKRQMDPVVKDSYCALTSHANRTGEVPNKVRQPTLRVSSCCCNLAVLGVLTLMTAFWRRPSPWPGRLLAGAILHLRPASARRVHLDDGAAGRRQLLAERRQLLQGRQPLRDLPLEHLGLLQQVLGLGQRARPLQSLGTGCDTDLGLLEPRPHLGQRGLVALPLLQVRLHGAALLGGLGPHLRHLRAHAGHALPDLGRVRSVNQLAQQLLGLGLHLPEHGRLLCQLLLQRLRVTRPLLGLHVGGLQAGEQRRRRGHGPRVPHAQLRRLERRLQPRLDLRHLPLQHGLRVGRRDGAQRGVQVAQALQHGLGGLAQRLARGLLVAELLGDAQRVAAPRHGAQLGVGARQQRGERVALLAVALPGALRAPEARQLVQGGLVGLVPARLQGGHLLVQEARRVRVPAEVLTAL